MSSLIGSHGVAIATAMAAVSGTVILITVCRQKPLNGGATTQFTAAAAAAAHRSPANAGSHLRSCISSDESKRELRGSKKKKKRVHFAKDVVVEFNKESSGEEEEEEEEEENSVSARGAAKGSRRMPANRAALYHGILLARSQRM